MQIHLIVQWIWKRKLLVFSNEKELVDFVRKNEVEYLNSYYKLIDYIEAYVKAENLGGSYHSLIENEKLDKGFEKNDFKS